jgi:hypothetical protein
MQFFCVTSVRYFNEQFESCNILIEDLFLYVFFVTVLI